MAILLDKISAFNNSEILRLSIQTDLSGFSFIVHDTNNSEIVHYSKYSYPDGITRIEDTEYYINKEFRNNDIISKRFGKGTSLFHDTEKYTLIPKKYFKEDSLKDELSKLYTLDELDELYSVELPYFDAVLAYVIPNSITSPVYLAQKGSKFYPVSYPLINQLHSIEDHNRLIVYFKKGSVHVIAAQGDQLLLCNTYPAKDFNTAIYFIFLAVKEVMFNPELTTLNLFGSVSFKDYRSISRYFKEIKRREFSEIL